MQNTIKNRTTFSGFSLMELLVTVVIVGVLATVAIPSYRDAIARAKRADALSFLSEGAQNQERFYTLNNQYMATKTVPAPPNLVSDYKFDYTTVADGSYYSYTATALGSQSTIEMKKGASGCHILVLDSTGNQNPIDCW